MEFTFPIVKLLDFAKDPQALARSENPFGTVVLAHWQGMQTRMNPMNRQQEKLKLVKSLFAKNWSKEDVRELFRLIDWIMTLPMELEEEFRAEMYQFEKESKMPWLSSIERIALEKGREEGREKGREEGLLEAIALDLESMFGKPGLKLLPKARGLKHAAELRQFARFLKSSKSLDEVRGYLRSREASK